MTHLGFLNLGGYGGGNDPTVRGFPRIGGSVLSFDRGVSQIEGLLGPPGHGWLDGCRRGYGQRNLGDLSQFGVFGVGYDQNGIHCDVVSQAARFGGPFDQTRGLHQMPGLKGDLGKSSIGFGGETSLGGGTGLGLGRALVEGQTGDLGKSSIGFGGEASLGGGTGLGLGRALVEGQKGNLGQLQWIPQDQQFFNALHVPAVFPDDRDTMLMKINHIQAFCGTADERNKSLTLTYKGPAAAACQQLEEAAGGGRKGGGNDSDDSDNDGSGNDDKDKIARDLWKKMKSEAKKRKQLYEKDNRKYVRTKLDIGNGSTEDVLVSKDTASHGGAQFKVYEVTNNQAKFKGSLDHNLKFMSNKHESQAGKSFRLADLKQLS